MPNAYEIVDHSFDVIVLGAGGAGGYLEMNVYKPVMIANIAQSITLLSDGCTNFRKFLVEGTQPNRKKIAEYVDRSLMLVTALAPVIGYDKASAIAHFAADKDLTLKEAALKLGHEELRCTFDARYRFSIPGVLSGAGKNCASGRAS